MLSVFHPMGFPVEIESNSIDILRAAQVIWGRYPTLAESEVVRVRFDVSAAKEEIPVLLEPSHVAFEGDWMSVDHGPNAHARANLAEGWAEVSLPAARAAQADYVNYHFLEPIAHLLLAPPHYAFAHASCIALNGRALVLCGEAEAGKTCLAYACARAGWTFLSGDATHFLHQSGEFAVAGRPFSIRFRESARELFPELRAWPSELRPNGKKSIEVATAKLNILTALRARASHLVFPERREGAKVKIEPMSADEAFDRLNIHVFFGGERIRAAQRATLHRYTLLPCARLVYSDLQEAEAALRALIPDAI